MDQEKIGKFILEMRKQKGLTQKELAEKIGISDKTISKWECGNSMPDISYLDALCNSLTITVNELLSGECLTTESYSEKAEENIMALMKESNKKEGKGKMFLGFVLITIGIVVWMITSEGISALQYIWNYYVDFFGILIFMVISLGEIFLSGKKTKEEKLGVLQKLAIPNGVLLSMMELMSMLRRLDDPKAIGPSVAMAILLIMYGVVTYIVTTLLLEHKKAE